MPRRSSGEGRHHQAHEQIRAQPESRPPMTLVMNHTRGRKRIGPQAKAENQDLRTMPGKSRFSNAAGQEAGSLFFGPKQKECATQGTKGL